MKKVPANGKYWSCLRAVVSPSVFGGEKAWIIFLVPPEVLTVLVRRLLCIRYYGGARAVYHIVS